MTDLPLLIEKGYIPDFLLRLTIRGLLWKRILSEKKPDCGLQQERLRELIGMLKSSDIAVQTDKANEQHYEVPAGFFERVLGRNLKYSSCLWNSGDTTLDQAEEAMLALYAERAGLQDGMDILELGCGWGSFSLWMAEKFPGSRVTGVSNSASQREFIEKRASERGLDNLRILTADMNAFQPEGRFDRIVSIEMFEHMRNYRVLLGRIAEWLKDQGKLFVHIFCHREYPYLFEVRGRADWMARYFFSGGIMPSDDLLLYFQEDLQLEDHWNVNGLHYSKTAAAWLRNMERQHTEILGIMADVYGEKDKSLWYARWKLFFMACEELFGFRRGNEWFVSHYLFSKR